MSSILHIFKIIHIMLYDANFLYTHSNLKIYMANRTQKKTISYDEKKIINNKKIASAKIE